MIIGSGWAKGTSLKVPSGLDTRPTGARVRGAIQNMLAPLLPDALFLDLFAGSGAMGLEAVSRGARGAVFVEAAREAQRCLSDNIREVKRRGQAQGLDSVVLDVVAVDVGKSLAQLNRWAPFDVIFVDPPYKDVPHWAEVLLPALLPLTATAGHLIFESDQAGGGALAGGAPGWELLKQKSYGDTMVSMLVKA